MKFIELCISRVSNVLSQCTHTGLDYILGDSIVNISAQTPDPSLTFEVTIDLVNDDEAELRESFSVSLQLLTSVNVSDESNLTTTIIILDNGM